MRCRNIKVLLPDLAAGMLGSNDERYVTEHLRSCHSCQRDLERYTSLFEEILPAGKFSEDNVDWNAFGVELNSRIDAHKSRRRISGAEIYAVAAISLLLVVIGVSLFYGGLMNRVDEDSIEYGNIDQHLQSHEAAAMFVENMEGITVLDLEAEHSGIKSSFIDMLPEEQTTRIADELLLASLGHAALLSAGLEYLDDGDAITLLSDDESNVLFTILEQQHFSIQ